MLTVVGIGPGEANLLCGAAREAIEEADLVVGYKLYIDLLEKTWPQQTYRRGAMTQEIDRCREALEEAKTKKVVLVSSGDAGIYGMAGLCYALQEQMAPEDRPDVELIPGITAAVAAAARLGAPLANDWATVSLSDHLTPWEVIEKRVRAMAKADIPIAIYNPRSAHRPDTLAQALAWISEIRPPETLVGQVKRAYREGEEIRIEALSKVDPNWADMQTLVIVGNSQTSLQAGKMVCARGYEKKAEF